MCGIFTLLNNNEHLFSKDFIKQQFIKGKSRGPESSKLEHIFIKTLFGFHRLAINGLNDKSNQPFQIDNICLICNGEIYNYKQLYKMMNITPETDSDCEVILHLYKKYGIEQTLTMLDGVFAFVLCDYRNSSIDNSNLVNKIYVARDPYGVRPLYYLSPIEDSVQNIMLYGFSSELKCLSKFSELNEDKYQTNQNKRNKYKIEQFTPGTYSEFVLSNKVLSQWRPIKTNIAFHIPCFPFQLYENLNITQTSNQSSIFNVNSESYSIVNQMSYCVEIQKKLVEAVNKRCITTERPVACLLSGGLDSSLITALVNEFQKKNTPDKPLETYSIGLEGSVDLFYARKVADYLKTNHTEIIVTEQEMFEVIPELIQTIESYDTTTVRASIGNYLLGKYISKHSDAKVIFNGDGSDELCGGYLYMNHCPDVIEFDCETRRLLKDIHLFDVLRSDRSISSNGLEPRTPFLDRSFTNYYLSIPPQYRFHKVNNQCEKYLLRRSFSRDIFTNINGNQLLPDEILWRRKEAFSDGVSCQGRSLFEILQEKIADKLNQENESLSNLKENMIKPKYEVNIETEKYYYKKIFDEFYSNQESILPYFWMPKYTDAKDPSARTLKIYQK